MANQQNFEFEEAITCPVCLSRFDETEKKPKYLVSCCHTICRSCLETITRSEIRKRVICPICRGPTDCSGGVDSLPTNSDKLYLLKLENPFKGSDDETMNWCFTCRKRTSYNCATENHSVIAMNTQLLNSEIQLNMGNISSRLRVCEQSILQNRIEIGSKLEHVGQWLSSHQKMIEELKTMNSSRIAQLSGIQESGISISIQKLMQLSISKEPDVELLADNLKEETLTKKILDEFEVLENTAEISTMGRFCSLLDLPSVPHLRKELDYSNFFQNQAIRSQWPIVLIESLSSDADACRENPPVSNHDEFDSHSAENLPNMSFFPHEPIRRESRYFSSLNRSENANTDASSRIASTTVFRFGTLGSSTTSSDSRVREFLRARRRRLYANNFSEAN